MNKFLDSIYYNTNNPACYAGIQAVVREAKKKKPYIRQSDVREYLHRQRTYTLHKPIHRKFKRNKIKSFRMDTHWQTDLCDMQKIAKYNASYKYVLTCFDVFSKFGWAEPIKDKSSFSTAKGFEKILG